MAREKAKDKAKEKGKEKQAKAEPGSGLHGAALPLAAVAFGTLLGLGYFIGLVGERPTAILCALALALVLAALILRAVFEHTSGPFRAAGIALTLGSLFVALYPACVVLLPGKPAAQAVLRKASDQIALPQAGDYRLLVSTHLAPGAGKSVEYRLETPDQAIEGTFARTESWRRSRRGSYEVVDQHDSDSHEVHVPAGASIKLSSITGESSGDGISVLAYRILPRSMLWWLFAAMVLFGGFLETLVAMRGTLAGAAAAAGTFGLLMLEVSPRTAAGSVLGSAMLAAGAGAVAGALIGGIAGRIRKRRAAAKEAAAGNVKRSAGAAD